MENIYPLVKQENVRKISVKTKSKVQQLKTGKNQLGKQLVKTGGGGWQWEEAQIQNSQGYWPTEKDLWKNGTTETLNTTRTLCLID